MTPRRAAVLAMNLPAGAETWVAANSDKAWTTGDYLAALSIDYLAAANWQRSGDAKAAKPKPLPRPRDTRESTAKVSGFAAKARAFRARRLKQSDEPKEA